MVRGVNWGSIALCLIMLAGCRPDQDMAHQPRYKPLAASTFFEDGRSARELVPETVARGHLQLEDPVSSGQHQGEVVTDLPLPLTRELLARGRERYNIYCSPCHDQVGTGQGMIVQRGYPRPPSFHIPPLRQAPPGHFFAVITHGYGAMPGYRYLVSPQDRWAITAYIRALQLSQYAPVADLPAEVRQQLEASQ
jgi:hypothetical protein